MADVRRQIADAMLRAGFPPEEIQRGVAIALAESGGRLDATNDTPGQEYSVGPWQINLHAHGSKISEADARDLDSATAYAYSLWKNQGWQPWGAYTNGSFQRHMAEVGGMIGGYSRDECKANGGTWVEGSGCIFSGDGATSAGGQNKSGGGYTFGTITLPGKPATWFDKTTGQDRPAVFNVGNGVYQIQFEDGSVKYYDEKDAFPAGTTPDKVTASVAAQLGLGYAQLGQNAYEFGQTQATTQQKLSMDWKMFQEQFGMDKAKFNITQTFNESVQKWREATDARDFEAAEFWKNKTFEFEELKFAEDTRRFGLTFAENQRQFDTQTMQANADRDVRRGETLLSLGSRPDTLMRYLYALQGQQTPQGMETLEKLPGFGPNGQNPAIIPGQNGSAPVLPGGGGGGSASGPRPPTAGAGGAAQTYMPSVVPAQPGQTFPGIPQGANVVSVGGTPISLANGMSAAEFASKLAPYPGAAPTTPSLPGMSGGSTYDPNTDPNKGTMYAGASGFNTDGTMRLSANDPDAAGLMAKYPGRYRIGFADGGVIPEPVIGVGQKSGQMYEFGEEGPEAVVPNDMFERLTKDADEIDYSEDKDRKRHIKVKRAPKQPVNSYAAGGTIGYDPTQPTAAMTSDWASKGWSLAPMPTQRMDNFPTPMPLPAPPQFNEQIQPTKPLMPSPQAPQQRMDPFPSPPSGGATPWVPPPMGPQPVEMPMIRPQVEFDPRQPWRGGFQNGQWVNGTGVGPKGVPPSPPQGGSGTYDPPLTIQPIEMPMMGPLPGGGFGRIGGGTAPTGTGVPGFDHSQRDFTNSNVFQGQFTNRSVLPGGVPNLPQVRALTGGGGLIPSMQRLSQASPTERSFYEGYLRDVEGVQPNDVFEAAQRLGVRNGRVRTPKSRGRSRR